MTNNNANEPPAQGRSADTVDPQRVFESLTSELEYLVEEAPAGSGPDLLRVHGALLAYNLEGRAELLPTPRFGLSMRSWRERRVIDLARRLIARGAGDPALTMRLAADEIARHLHAIDLELGARVA